MTFGKLAIVRCCSQANVRSMVKKYGLPMLVTSDDSLKEYLTTVLSQVQGMSAPPISLARFKQCNGLDTLTHRMAHDILHQPPRPGNQIRRNGRNPRTLAIRDPHRRASGVKPSTLTGKTSTGGKKKEKTEKEVQNEIQQIMKQITSTTTFLPLLEEECKPA
jgi:mitotic spindle assembly checkpoint protein MAD2